MRKVISTFFVLAVLLMWAGSAAQAMGMAAPKVGADASLQLVGQLGGSTSAVAIRPPYVYAGIGQRLAVFDIGDPVTMTLMGQTDLLPSIVDDIALDGEFAYVADHSGGLQVIDISQPQAPHPVGAFRMPGDVVRVALAPPYAYILNAQLGLRILDISDPTQPQRLGAYTDLNRPSQLKIVGDRLYVASDTGRIVVFDRSQPASLSLLTRFSLPFLYINDFVIVENTFFVAGIDDWAERYLGIYDLTDLQHPLRLSMQTVPGAYGLAIQQDIAYVSAGPGGLSVWDISDLHHPAEINTYRENQVSYYQLQLAYPYLVVAQIDKGLGLFELSAKGQMTLRSHYRTLGAGKTVAVYDHYLYDYLGWNKVGIIDVAAPNHPTVAHFFTNTHWSSGNFVIQDTLAYVKTADEGVQIFDVSQPLSPQRIAAMNPFYYTMFAAPSRLYLWVGEGVQIYDTSFPQNMQLLATILPDLTLGQLYVDDNRLYVTHGLDGLEIYDLNDLADVKLLGAIDTPGNAGNLLVHDGYVYVDDGNSIAIINANDPQHPFLATTIDPPGDIIDMAYEHPNLFIVSSGYYADPQGTGGIMIFDLSLPALPRQRAHITQLSRISDIEVAGSALYVGADDSGIAIYQQSLTEPQQITWLPRLRRPSSTYLQHR